MLVCCLAVASLAMAQAAFVNEDRVAVFYPKDYDARQHQPSPVFVHEPVAVNPLPHDWRLRPEFSVSDQWSTVTAEGTIGADMTTCPFEDDIRLTEI